MREKTFVVRIVTEAQDFGETPALQELQYDYRFEPDRLVVHRQNEEGMCFDLRPPFGREGKVTRGWSEIAAAAMRNRGFNAVSAPAYANLFEDDSKSPLKEGLDG